MTVGPSMLSPSDGDVRMVMSGFCGRRVATTLETFAAACAASRVPPARKLSKMSPHVPTRAMRMRMRAASRLFRARRRLVTRRGGYVSRMCGRSSAVL